jgi:hypothetical protein
LRPKAIPGGGGTVLAAKAVRATFADWDGTGHGEDVGEDGEEPDGAYRAEGERRPDLEDAALLPHSDAAVGRAGSCAGRAGAGAGAACGAAVIAAGGAEGYGGCWPGT